MLSYILRTNCLSWEGVEEEITVLVWWVEQGVSPELCVLCGDYGCSPVVFSSPRWIWDHRNSLFSKVAKELGGKGSRCANNASLKAWGGVCAFLVIVPLLLMQTGLGAKWDAHVPLLLCRRLFLLQASPL